MARNRRGQRREEPDATPAYDDFIYDGLESIKRDLPSGEPEGGSAYGDASDTPEQALSKLADAVGDAEEAEEDIEYARAAIGRRAPNIKPRSSPFMSDAIKGETES